MSSTSVRLFEIVVSVVGLAACNSVSPVSPVSPVSDDVSGDVSGDVPGDVESGSTDRPGTNTAPPEEFISCAGLPATCGADRNDTCCTSLGVTGGEFFRFFDVANDPGSGTTGFPAFVGDFRLDKYEVTVGRFRAFVNAGLGTRSNPPAVGSGANPNIAGSGWQPIFTNGLLANKAALISALNCDQEFGFQTWTDAPGPNENRPIDCVNWFEAMAFCLWDGGYLPSEAEWNYAAAGGDEQRAYPWSAPPGSLALDPAGANASYSPDGGGLTCVGDGSKDCDINDLVEAGSKPAGAGRFGQTEMAGNLSEWTLDSGGKPPTKCTDCANLAPSNRRIHRGGNYTQGDFLLRTGARGSRFPFDHTNFIGLRCARPAL